MSNRALKEGGPVVIIGGGVIGLSIAYHLTKRGYTDVVVFERDELASGSTSKATGGIRQQFSSDINIALSRRSVEFFERFTEITGEPITFRQSGYLFLLSQAEDMEAFRRNAAKQQAAGVPVQVLDPVEIRDVMPKVRTDDLVGATYCPTDGAASPNDVAQAFARQARSRGARILEHTEVIGVERAPDGRVVGVRTADGEFPAEIVINAAGPWGALVGELVGLDIPVEPHPRQAFVIHPLPWLTLDLPLTVDFSTGTYVHPEANGGIIGGGDRSTSPDFHPTVDWDKADALFEAIVHRVPALADAEIRREWVGLREMTPDDHGLLGPSGVVPGFWLATGFSGHGFMHAPAIGRIMSDWLLDGDPGLDVDRLSFARFAEGPVMAESSVF